jgi:glutamate racemase
MTNDLFSICIFDSGVDGLSVLRAIRVQMLGRDSSNVVNNPFRGYGL